MLFIQRTLLKLPTKMRWKLSRTMNASLMRQNRFSILWLNWIEASQWMKLWTEVKNALQEIEWEGAKNGDWMRSNSHRKLSGSVVKLIILWDTRQAPAHRIYSLNGIWFFANIFRLCYHTGILSIAHGDSDLRIYWLNADIYLAIIIITINY